VIRNADWILDLGPEGGEDGGRVVGEGRPIKIAATPGSYTGQFLLRYYTGPDGRLVKAESEEEIAASTPPGAPPPPSGKPGKPAAKRSKTKTSDDAKPYKRATFRNKKTGRP